MVFLPSDNLGLVVLVNTDDKQDYGLAVIYRIVEDFLGLPRVHSSRLVADLQSKADKQIQNTTSICGSVIQSAAPLALDEYTGVYTSPGYPNITVCAPTSHSVECELALEDFAHLEDLDRSQSLYLIFPTIWLSNGRLRHTRDNIFGLSVTALFPHGYGKDTSPFEIWNPMEPDTIFAEFVVEASEGGHTEVVGMAVNGLVDELTERQRMGGSIEETAEIYFVKV